ncbi:MAG: ATPase domain-containing protein [Herpetosiphon sp.]
MNEESLIPAPRVRAKISAGSAALDVILGGGIPRESVNIISGPPGVGKTILALQIAFSAAGEGRQAIYFTNVSEPHAKIIEHMRDFAFYKPELVGDKLQLYNITREVRLKGLKDTLDFIVGTVRREKADVVVVDSFRGLKHVLATTMISRSAIFDITAQLSILGCTTVLVGEYTPEETETEPEFAVADSIMKLSYDASTLHERRIFRISKMRGVNYVGGNHYFVVNQSGLDLYPRQESLVYTPEYLATNIRVPFGVHSLDQLLHGGPLRSSSTLLAGSAGTGKTLLSLHFLAAGVRDGETVLLVSFQEGVAQLRLRAAQFGLSAELGESSARAHMLAVPPVELLVDQVAAKIRAMVTEFGIRRVVIDSVSEIEAAIADIPRFDNFLASLIGFFRVHEVTMLLIREIPQLFGMELALSSRGLSYISDNIILLRYVELQGTIRRIVTVLKSRASDHDKHVRELLIREGTIEVTDRISNASRLMTGLPEERDGSTGAPRLAQ